MTFYEKCKERTSNLMDFAINANQSYMTILVLRDLQANKNEIANISPAFYRSVFRSCLQSLFIDVSKVYDKNRKNESTYNLLSTMQDNLDQLDSACIAANHFHHLGDRESYVVRYDTVEKMIEGCLVMIEQHSLEISSLKTLRNKYYAHLDRDSQNDLNKLFRENSVSLATIEKLLTLNVNIMNSLYKYFNDSTVFPVISNHDDFKKTVWCVEKYREHRKEMFS